MPDIELPESVDIELTESVERAAILVRAARRSNRFDTITRAMCSRQCNKLCEDHRNLCIAGKVWADLANDIVDALERQDDIENEINKAVAQALAERTVTLPSDALDANSNTK